MKIEDLSAVCELSGERHRLLRDIAAVETLADVVVTVHGNRVSRTALEAVQPSLLSLLRADLADVDRGLAGLGVRV